MAYIGTSPSQGVRHRYLFTATSGQTTFSGADDDSRTLSYTDTKFMDVFLNGVLLDPNSDYTATNGTSVVLTSGASAGDLLEVIAFDSFSVFSGTFGGDVTVNGAFTSQGIDDNALSTSVTIDGSGNVGIGTSSPTGKLSAYTTSYNPGSSDWTKAAVIASGSFGGGIALIDGSAGYSLYAESSGSNFIIAQGSTSGGQTERMRIDSSGQVLVGKSTGTVTLNGVQIRGTGDTYYSIANSNNTLHVFDTTSALYRFYVKGNGGIANYSANNTNLSDEREKKNIENLQSTWDCLKEWEIKKFHYNSDDDNIDKRYGVIAQQVQVNCPEVVSDWKVQDAQEEVLWQEGDELPEGVSVGDVKTPAQEEITRLGVKESQMYWMAIKALQEAIAKIETLEVKVAALENA